VWVYTDVFSFGFPVFAWPGCRHRQRTMCFRFYNCRFRMEEMERYLSTSAYRRYLMRRSWRKMMHGAQFVVASSNTKPYLPIRSLNHFSFFRDCPKCKTKRRTSKKLSLARLPPVLLIHLKRFEANGRFSDKVDTFVEFPMKLLDMTDYMPPPLPPGADKSELNGGLPMSLDDPRTQLPPYRYDLYGVTNHYGNLTSGHCEFYSDLMTFTFFCIPAVVFFFRGR